MNPPLKLLSSMATRQLLADLVDQSRQARGLSVELEAVGGVDAARRVEAGEAFDVVVLASGAIDGLIAAGRLVANSKRALVSSAMAVAVPAGRPHPDLTTETSLREAIRSAPSVGYSTGPSGAHFLGLLERWKLTAEMGGRLIQAPPGVPVGTLIARGEVSIGFQQQSELANIAGLEIAGLLPPGASLTTIFSAAVASCSSVPDQALDLIGFMNLPEHDVLKRRHGLEPA